MGKKGQIVEKKKQMEQEKDFSSKQEEMEQLEENQVSQKVWESLGEIKRVMIQLQCAIEELELKNQKLQEANQELLDWNQELQSKNQSNRKTIEGLVGINQDLDDLLIRSKIGALYLDSDLCIRKITPVMEQNTLLLSSDVGRCVEYVRFMNQYLNFSEDVKTSMEKKIVIEKEVVSKDGMNWLIRIQPYDKEEKKGVLVVLIDMTKWMEAAKYELKLLTNNVPGGVAKMRYDNGLIVEYANEGLFQIMNMTKEEFSSHYHNYYDRMVLPEDWAMMRKQIEAAVKTKEQLKLEYRVLLSDGSICWRLIQAMLLEERSAPILQCIISDITDLKEMQNQLKSLIDNIPSAVLRFYYDIQRKEAKLVFISDRGFEMLGLSRKEYEVLYGNQDALVIFGENRERVIAALDSMIQTGQELHEEYHMHREDGSDIWLSMRSSVVAKEGEGYLIQSIASDVTEQKENLNRIGQEQEKLNTIAEMSADLIFEYDVVNDWMHYSNSRLDIIGQEMITEKYSKNIISSGLIYPEDLPAIQDFCQALKEGRPEMKLEVRKKYADGVFHWSSIHAKTLYNQDGKPIRVVGTTSNIDERKLEEEKLKKRSERDSLTNLYNHMTMKTLVDERLRGETQEAWLLVMDVDDFKQVNDSLGHLYGDAVLCSFADELVHVFDSPWTGRIGGDEFCVLAVGETKESICKKMELFNRRIRKKCSSEGSKISVSSSIGAAKYLPDVYQYDLLFKQADSALYYVKNHGKSNYQIYDPMVCSMDNEEASWCNEKDDIIRRDALFADEQDLLVFSLELLERVDDVQNAMKVICDRICRFFHFDDMIIVERDKQGKLEIHYRFNRFEERDGIIEAEKGSSQDLDWICSMEPEKDIRIWNQEALKAKDPEFGNTSLFCVALDKDILPEGYFLFWDRKKDHDWTAYTGILRRLANILCSKLIQYNENKKREERLAFIESYDSLTQLPNYKKFLSLSEEYRKEHPEKKFFCTYSDFSNFQYLNEIYGFAVGNEVLYGFAAALRERCEGIVYASHINADHFLVLHEGKDIHTLCRLFEQMTKEYCEEISQLYPLCKLFLVSGISEVKPEACDITYYIDNANVARKTAKGRGETCCVEFASHMKRQIEKQIEITTSMQKALDNGEFVVYLQPKVSLKDEQVVGAEALVRWIKEDGTILRPDEFVPLFEKNGFIKHVDFKVLEQVLVMLRQQLNRGEKVVPVSVNFSRRNQEDEEFVDHVLACLNHYQVPPELIQAEVTESVYLYDLKILDENMKRLKRSGVSISIDDFGAEYSSLNILSKVSADTIKLDKQFLKESEKEKLTPEFIKYLVMMIKQLGFGIVAEGVETKEQVRMLKEAGCDQVQGYYYARPMPVKEFLEYLDRERRR